MSLIVTSNVNLEDRPETSNAFKPYSYQNSLLNTMKIPPNSEIALQSVKINKDGLIVLDRANCQFAHYFGPEIGSTFVPDLSHSTTQPFIGFAGGGEAFEEGQRVERNIDGFASDIQLGIGNALFHPALVKNTGDGGIEVAPVNNATTKVFEGYEFKFTQHTNTNDLGGAGRNIVNIGKQTDAAPRATKYPFVYDAGTGVITASTKRGFYVQARNKPITQLKGEVIWDITGLNGAGTQSPFMVGLSRLNSEKFTALGDYHAPDFFNPDRGAAGGQFRRSGQVGYADICVTRAGSLLHVFQSGVNSAGNGGGRDETIMNEIVYYGAHNAGNFGSQYNLQTNSLNFEQIGFRLTNEHIEVFAIDNKGAEILIIDHIVAVSKGAEKNEMTNPICASKWTMYPVAMANFNGATTKLEKYTVYTDYPDFAAFILPGEDYTTYDWWGYSEARGATEFCNELEARFWNDKNSNRIQTPQLTNVSNGMANYKNILICSQSAAYGEATTDQCNTTRTFGFEGMSVTHPPFAHTNTVTTLRSVSVPRLIGNVSLFVRLNNFTQNSINARKGTISKIVGHLPRFDNSGNETGGLFFEPHEKTYLALNNPAELNISSFDVDIVYDNETLCTALSGKTIVCFHIRKMK